MKTKNLGKLILILFLLGLFVYFGSEGFKFEFYGNVTCKPIYVQDYHFICCVKDQNPSPISSEVYATTWVGTKLYAPIKCPTEAVECKFNGVYNAIVYSECHTYQNIFGGTEWSCSGQIQSGNSLTFQPSQWIWDDSSLYQHQIQLTINVYNKKLVDCGTAGCTQGVTVPGSTGCTFQTNWRVYDAKGNLVSSQNPQSTLSYTVPYGECYYYTTDSLRHIAGDTCEYCKSDDDCVAGHTYKYYYNGRWYGAEATTATMLSLYGCKNYGQRCVNKDSLPQVGDKCFAYATESRCEAIYTISVQCVPGSSICGENAFCDPQTFTCKPKGEVGCKYDWECGTQTICDYTTKTLKTPKCQNGKCTFVEQPVECCYDVNCPSGYMCDADHKCKQITHPKTTCPYECCVNDVDYFDKPCANNVPCVDHKCTYYQICNNNGICEADKGENSNNCPSDCKEIKFNWNYLWAFLAGLLSFLIIGQKDIKKRDWIKITIAGILGLFVGVITFFILENLTKIILGSVLAMIFGGIILWFLGPAILAIVAIFMAIIRTIRGD
jgi:hypothetical protein